MNPSVSTLLLTSTPVGQKRPIAEATFSADSPPASSQRWPPGKRLSRISPHCSCRKDSRRSQSKRFPVPVPLSRRIHFAALDAAVSRSCLLPIRKALITGSPVMAAISLMQPSSSFPWSWIILMQPVSAAFTISAIDASTKTPTVMISGERILRSVIACAGSIDLPYPGDRIKPARSGSIRLAASASCERRRPQIFTIVLFPVSVFMAALFLFSFFFLLFSSFLFLFSGYCFLFAVSCFRLAVSASFSLLSAFCFLFSVSCFRLAVPASFSLLSAFCFLSPVSVTGQTHLLRSCRSCSPLSALLIRVSPIRTALVPLR